MEGRTDIASRRREGTWCLDVREERGSGRFTSGKEMRGQGELDGVKCSVRSLMWWGNNTWKCGGGDNRGLDRA